LRASSTLSSAWEATCTSSEGLALQRKDDIQQVTASKLDAWVSKRIKQEAMDLSEGESCHAVWACFCKTHLKAGGGCCQGAYCCAMLGVIAQAFKPHTRAIKAVKVMFLSSVTTAPSMPAVHSRKVSTCTEEDWLMHL
jgi:hypothetical protein